MPAQKKNTITHLNNSDDIDIDIDIDAKLIYRTFGLSEKMIETLKARALQNGKGPYSSFVVVAAHFWRCMIKAREVAEQQDINFCFLADNRNFVRPPLPSHWFGNCVQFGKAQTMARELLNREFSFAVDLIQNAVNSCTNKNLKRIENWLEDRDCNSEADASTFDEKHFINVISSPKFPVYEIDYGWGKPVKVQEVSIEKGAMVLFPIRGGATAMEVSTCLPLAQMDVFHYLLFTLPDSC